jgi:hypothetical protein
MNLLLSEEKTKYKARNITLASALMMYFEQKTFIMLININVINNIETVYTYSCAYYIVSKTKLKD